MYRELNWKVEKDSALQRQSRKIIGWRKEEEEEVRSIRRGFAFLIINGINLIEK